MSWFIRRPYWLHSELQELRTNGNYVEVATHVNKTMVSSGEILVRLQETHRFPVLIVYPDATPYYPIRIYLTKEALPPKEVYELSKLSPGELASKIQKRIKFYYHRHQNIDGSLCILETDDLHDDRPELIRVREVIERTRQWFRGHLTGKFPPDSLEVELYYHFPNHFTEAVFLLPDEFFSPQLLSGKFYFFKTRDYTPKTHYFGFIIEGITESGLSLFLPDATKDKGYFFHKSLPLDVVDLTARNEKASEFLENGTIIEGWWWHVDKEPLPFATPEQFAEYIDPINGLTKVAEASTKKLKNGEENIFVALRFYNRRKELEWQFFNLKKVVNEGIPLPYSIEDARKSLMARQVQAIRTEKITEKYFHLRNSSRADRSILKEKAVTVIGTGALGSSLTENLAKAGVGHITLVDKDTLHGHNVIRHTCGLIFMDWLKCNAVALNSVALHNPFVKVSIKNTNILCMSIDGYFDSSSVGISTIADDTVEHYLNEESVRTGRTVFYARALRGGKAARIFRVKPGVDACKECLVHYKKENSGDFISIEEDPDLHLLTNECNNPVRPGSGADMNVIAGLLSRFVIDYLQGSGSDYNHWIWYTEGLGSQLSLDKNQWAACHRQFIPPHPKCRLCQRIEPKEVLLTEESFVIIRREAAASGQIETGGILIGFRNETGNIVVVRATGPGPKAVRTEARFEKDIEYCQQQLIESSQSLGLKGQYVGEWHYHPTGTNEPSGTDIKSLAEIARQVNYATDEPVMVIVSPDLELAFTIHPTYRGFVRTTFKVIDSGLIKQMKCQEA